MFALTINTRLGQRECMITSLAREQFKLCLEKIDKETQRKLLLEELNKTYSRHRNFQLDYIDFKSAEFGQTTSLTVCRRGDVVFYPIIIKIPGLLFVKSSLSISQYKVILQCRIVNTLDLLIDIANLVTDYLL
jgi:hypothetical protein